MAEDSASFHDQIVEQTGTKMEEDFWQETQEWMKKNPPHIPPTETLGEMRDREKREADEAARLKKQEASQAPQPETITKPEDNEHFKGERRIFQVTRMNMIGDPGNMAIRGVEVVHIVDGVDWNGKGPVFKPAVVSDLNGTTLVEVNNQHGPKFYKTVPQGDVQQAEEILKKYPITAPTEGLKTVFVEFVPPSVVEKLKKDGTQVIKAAHFEAPNG